ncbi:MAG: serine hydrolase [Bacteroidales bacterium]
MKKKKPIIYILIAIAIFAIFYVTLPRHIVRYFIWNYADINDDRKFDKLEVKKGKTSFYFNKVSINTRFKIPEKNSGNDRYESFDQFLEEKGTVAFLVVKNDTLIYENYFEGYDSSSIIPSFSVSKSFVSALVGIAISEGYIYSTGQSITFFLKELGPEFDKITIGDLLNMRSGIKFNEGYNSPFADMAKYYYGTDLKRYIKELTINEPPDQTYDYISVNTLLLGLIVERATNTKLTKYLEQKIWQPLQMESDASWSIDSEKNQTEKAFCCINAVARDFAKFGLLYLKEGNWNGNQVVPKKWVKKSISIINDSRDSQGYPYTCQWRVLENGTFFAKGILGQYIIVYPAKNLVFVRLGKRYADVDWADFCLDLSTQL